HDGVSNEKLEWRERWSVRPNKYYLIDFGSSRKYRTDERKESEIGRIGRHRPAVPELTLPKLYDPFKLDVYQLGKALLWVVEEYEGLEVFIPMLKAMMSSDPASRPLPSETLKELDLDRLSYWKLSSRVWLRTETWLNRAYIMASQVG
ncbi:hypothetical protein H0H81_008563, partial [Sphagnurus paluster]